MPLEAPDERDSDSQQREHRARERGQAGRPREAARAQRPVAGVGARVDERRRERENDDDFQPDGDCPPDEEAVRHGRDDADDGVRVEPPVEGGVCGQAANRGRHRLPIGPGAVKASVCRERAGPTRAGPVRSVLYLFVDALVELPKHGVLVVGQHYVACRQRRQPERQR